MPLPIDALKEFYDGDVELINELINQFKADAPEGMQDLQDGIVAQDHAKIAGAAHKLVGSSGLLQLEDLTVMLKTMEQKATDNEAIDKLNLLFQGIDQSFKEVLADLENIQL